MHAREFGQNFTEIQGFGEKNFQYSGSKGKIILEIRDWEPHLPYPFWHTLMAHRSTERVVWLLIAGRNC